MEPADPRYVVRLATSYQDLRDACAVREAAYGHHDPETGQKFGDVEPLDQTEGTVVLLCRDQTSAQCVGTARIQVSAFGALTIESSVRLPGWLTSRPRAQVSRLAVLPGTSALVKLHLMKASYQYCLATRVRWMVIGARNNALIRNYRNLGFKDVFEPGVWLPLASVGGLLHQILAFDVIGADAAWQETKNRLYGFMTQCSDTDLRLAAANDGAADSQPMRLVA